MKEKKFEESEKIHNCYELIDLYINVSPARRIAFYYTFLSCVSKEFELTDEEHKKMMNEGESPTETSLKQYLLPKLEYLCKAAKNK